MDYLSNTTSGFRPNTKWTLFCDLVYMSAQSIWSALSAVCMFWIDQFYHGLSQVIPRVPSIILYSNPRWWFQIPQKNLAFLQIFIQSRDLSQARKYSEIICKRCIVIPSILLLWKLKIINLFWWRMKYTVVLMEIRHIWPLARKCSLWYLFECTARQAIRNGSVEQLNGCKFFSNG